MLSYPDHNDRGLFLGIWSAMRNSGSVVGGAINFSTNYSSSSAGGIAWSTYLIFVGFGKFLSILTLADTWRLKMRTECTGIIWAFMLSPARKVRRSDGSKIASSPNISWAAELGALWKHLQRKKVSNMYIC